MEASTSPLSPTARSAAWQAVLGLALVACGLGACALSAPIPTPGFRRLALAGVQPDLQRRALVVTLAVTFRFVNPLGVALPVPAHTFSLYLDGETSPAATQPMTAFSVPAGATAHDVTYPLQLTLGGPGSLPDRYLGRDVPFRLEARLSLPGPAGPGSLPITLAYDDTIRLPRFPEVQLAGVPRMRLLGQVRTVDVSAFRDPMLAVGDALVDNLGWLVDLAVATATLAGGDRAALTDPAKRQAFTAGWRRFKDDVPDRVLDLEASSLTGFRFEVPIRVVNPNRFRIQAPGALLAAGPGTTAPAPGASLAYVTVQYDGAGPDDGPPTIAASTATTPASRGATLVTEFRWTSLVPAGADPLRVLSALTTAATRPYTVQAAVNVDLGYGPVSVPVTIPVQLHLGP